MGGQVYADAVKAPIEFPAESGLGMLIVHPAIMVNVQSVTAQEYTNTKFISKGAKIAKAKELAARAQQARSSNILIQPIKCGHNYTLVGRIGFVAIVSFLVNCLL